MKLDSTKKLVFALLGAAAGFLLYDVVDYVIAMFR